MRAPKASERKDTSQAAPDTANQKPESAPADPQKTDELEQIKTEKQKADEEIDQLRKQIEEHDQTQPSVKVVEHQAEFDVWKGGREGIQIWATVDAHRLHGITCQMLVSLHYVNGTKRDIKSRSGVYADDRGNLTVARNFVPQSQEARIEGLKLFIPLDEIRTPTGTHRLRYVIKIRQINTHGYLAEEEGEEFTFTAQP
jgi:ribosomal protein L31E